MVYIDNLHYQKIEGVIVQVSLLPGTGLILVLSSQPVDDEQNESRTKRKTARNAVSGSKNDNYSSGDA